MPMKRHSNRDKLLVKFIRRLLPAAVVGIAAFSQRPALGYLTFGDEFFGGMYLKWGDPTFGTGATVHWGFMADGTDGTAIDGVMGASNITQMRSGFDATYGTGEFNAAIGRALATWSAATNINFIYSPTDTGLPVNDPGAALPEIRIGAFNPVPGSGFNFVGGEGFAPPPNGGTLEGDVLFNLSAGFQIAPGTEDVTPIDFFHGNDLEGLALHEIGHALGMAHPDPADSQTLPDDVMLIHNDGSPYLINRKLSADDLAGIQHIYGPRLKGDINLDGHVNTADISAMLAALTDLPAYEAANGISSTDLLTNADLDGDHAFTNADLQSLLNYLKAESGSLPLAVPEPSAGGLLAVGALLGLVLRGPRPRLRLGS
jgi:hypothetical protein